MSQRGRRRVGETISFSRASLVCHLRPTQADVNGFAFIEKPRPILIAELIPFFGLFAKSPSPCCR